MADEANNTQTEVSVWDYLAVPGRVVFSMVEGPARSVLGKPDRRESEWNKVKEDVPILQDAEDAVVSTVEAAKETRVYQAASSAAELAQKYGGYFWKFFPNQYKPVLLKTAVMWTTSAEYTTEVTYTAFTEAKILGFMQHGCSFGIDMLSANNKEKNSNNKEKVDSDLVGYFASVGINSIWNAYTTAIPAIQMGMFLPQMASVGTFVACKYAGSESKDAAHYAHSVHSAVATAQVVSSGGLISAILLVPYTLQLGSRVLEASRQPLFFPVYDQVSSLAPSMVPEMVSDMALPIVKGVGAYVPAFIEQEWALYCKLNAPKLVQAVPGARAIASIHVDTVRNYSKNRQQAKPIDDNITVIGVLASAKNIVVGEVVTAGVNAINLVNEAKAVLTPVGHLLKGDKERAFTGQICSYVLDHTDEEICTDHWDLPERFNAPADKRDSIPTREKLDIAKGKLREWQEIQKMREYNKSLFALIEQSIAKWEAMYSDFIQTIRKKVQNDYQNMTKEALAVERNALLSQGPDSEMQNAEKEFRINNIDRKIQQKQFIEGVKTELREELKGELLSHLGILQEHLQKVYVNEEKLDDWKRDEKYKVVQMSLLTCMQKICLMNSDLLKNGHNELHTRIDDVVPTITEKDVIEGIKGLWKEALRRVKDNTMDMFNVVFRRMLTGQNAKTIDELKAFSEQAHSSDFTWLGFGEEQTGILVDIMGAETIVDILDINIKSMESREAAAGVPTPVHYQTSELRRRTPSQLYAGAGVGGPS